MGEIAAINIKPTGHDSGKGEATAEKKKKYENQNELLDKIDLTGLG